MKKQFLLVAAVVAAVLAISLCACSSSNGGGSNSNAVSEYSADSLYAHHADTMGLDFSGITEVSYETCVSSGCHGDWDKIVADTDAMFAGLGQITDANPHDSHATNAFACSDCHSLTETSNLICNQCHIFTVPEGWTEPEKTGTNYGTTATEPMF